ncbi:endo alpha-1,4 polygalactosaminidase [Streptomyces bambusae]|uniref:endo alpha-1,4 polygalactosaminidase n=1 Tax=Streptomyces bambusae TaxID=1550616 RepID=UPI001CFE1158|nr:endo alpha-1,4 polygalactosaminidase [Streptomyces bambusae]MCB5165387.1 endo alpha-1,4 polygalactosaminidase [Streptomyces bambusae]
MVRQGAADGRGDRPEGAARRSRKVRWGAAGAVLAAGLAAGVLLPAAQATAPDGAAGTAGAAAPRVVLPRGNAAFDYQIGGAYTPAADVKVVSRDRSDKPAKGRYNICYVNGYQAQPEELRWWQKRHPDLLLKDRDGRYVVDGAWNEVLLDISSAAKRKRLAAIVGAWFDGCARSGYRAVEPDNLDSFSRSKRYLSKADSTAFAVLLAKRAHAAGLAIGQKNTPEMLADRGRIGFDFAVAEECGRYAECGAYRAVYGGRVYVIEYRHRDFTKACAAWARTLSVVERNRDVRTPRKAGYVRNAC